jgi:hypothetical protein
MSFQERRPENLSFDSKILAYSRCITIALMTFNIEKKMQKSVTLTILGLSVLCSKLVWPETAAQENPAIRKTVAVEAAAADQAAPAGMAVPEYDEQGALLRPEGFERWMVVGTSIGLSYSDSKATDSDNPGQFHNVYMQPQAFDYYVRTGEFPEQTIFVVTNNPSTATKGKDSLNRAGFFAAPSTGLEVAIRDSKRYPDTWAYFIFHNAESPRSVESSSGKVQTVQSRAAETAYPRAACYDCHAEHGAVDNVFTQFYSVLTQAREQHVTDNAVSGQ